MLVKLRIFPEIGMNIENIWSHHAGLLIHGMILSSISTVKHYLYFDSKGLQIGKVLEYSILPLGSMQFWYIKKFGLPSQKVAKSYQNLTSQYLPRDPITLSDDDWGV